MSQDTTQAAQEFESSIAKYFKAGGIYPAIKEDDRRTMTSKIWVHRLILLIQGWLEHRKRMRDISSNKKVESACCYFYHRTLPVVLMCHKSKETTPAI